MIAFALGLFGAAAVAGVREVLDDTFKTAEDVEEVLRLPVLGLAPVSRKQRWSVRCSKR